MKENKKKKLNNKGFSLVELLVAMAVGGIVLVVIGSFVTSGTRFFNKQSNSIDLQNELQVSSNRITDSLMEATSLVIKQDYAADKKIITIITGDFDNEDLKVKPKYIVWNEADGSLYVADQELDISNIDDFTEGYRLSEYVTEMTVKISDNCFEKLDNDDGTSQIVCVQPITVEVSLTVSNKKDSKSDTKTTTLRNRLEFLEYNGTSYVLQ